MSKSRSFEELTGTTEVATWIPEDTYADLIFESTICHGQLSGKIGAVDYDMAAGTGDWIQVRYVPSRFGVATSMSTVGCSCLSAVSTTVGAYPIRITPIGDYDRQCAFSLWKAKGNVKDAILNEMAKGLSNYRDVQMWANLVATGGIPTHRASLATTCSNVSGIQGEGIADECCALKVDLYNRVIQVQKSMQGAGYNPDTVIMHPTVAAWLYYKDFGGTVPHYQTPLVKWSGDGQLISIGPLKVIECCSAATCVNTATATLAVVLDSSRAIGEAWGKRPVFTEFYDNKCDAYDRVIWMYWGTHYLDPNAIGHIRNP